MDITKNSNTLVYSLEERQGGETSESGGVLYEEVLLNHAYNFLVSGITWKAK
jgi:hypothetical protein